MLGVVRMQTRIPGPFPAPCYHRAMTTTEAREWWRGAIMYQIYPRSFQDSNGDGIGDLEGIIRRLDYLNDGTERSLGVDAIWLSPTFPSPMKDFGYDVSDYCDVHADFGDLATMDRLIAECHKRGIRVLLDYVPNHSSDQHPWFQEARGSRTNAKRDWYVWRDAQRSGAPEGAPPNNWIAVFGGPAWEWDAATNQYYLHSFLVEQPDLNWRNPAVVAAMHDSLRFWFDRGIDGFRIDVMGMVLKHPEMPDNPPNPRWQPGMPEMAQQIWVHNRNHPDVFGAVEGIRAVCDEYPAVVTVGETFGTAEDLSRFYAGGKGLHLAFNFQFIRSDEATGPTLWEAETAARIIRAVEKHYAVGDEPCWAFGNHDRHRFISRYDDDGHGEERARAAAFLILGLRGVPFLYYGEEIGMVDGDIPEDRLQDPARFRYEGRDPERTPMQWDATPGRGFSRGEPWLPYGPDAINVAAQDGDRGSMLELYRQAAWARKRSPSLSAGSLEDLATEDNVLSFVRREPGEPAVLVAVNMAEEGRQVRLPGPGTILAATRAADTGSRLKLSLELPAFGAAWVVLEA